MIESPKMEFKRVGEVDGSPIYRRGDWYFAKNPEGNWCKLLWDWSAGKKMKYLLERDLQELKESGGDAPVSKMPDVSQFIEPL